MSQEKENEQTEKNVVLAEILKLKVLVEELTETSKNIVVPKENLITASIKSIVTTGGIFGVLVTLTLGIAENCSKNKEIQIQQTLKDKEIAIQQLKNESDSKSANATIIFNQFKYLTSINKEERASALAVIEYAVGKDATKGIIQAALNQPISEQVKKDLEEVQQTSQETSLYYKNWSGSWTHSFKGKAGDYKGTMEINVSNSGKLNATFKANNNVEGDLNGTILVNTSEQTSTVTGTWTNNKNQYGQFKITMKAAEELNVITFSGRYSPFTQPITDSSPTWEGKKTIQ